MSTDSSSAFTSSAQLQSATQSTLATPTSKVIVPIPVQPTHYGNFNYFDARYHIPTGQIQQFSPFAIPSHQTSIFDLAALTNVNQPVVMLNNNTMTTLTNNGVPFPGVGNNPSSITTSQPATPSSNLTRKTSTRPLSSSTRPPKKRKEKHHSQSHSAVKYNTTPATTAAAILSSLSSSGAVDTSTKHPRADRSVCPNPQCMNSKTKKARRYATNDRPLDRHQIEEFKKLYEENNPRDAIHFARFLKEWDEGKIYLNNEGEIRFCRACRNSIYMTLKEKGLKKKKKRNGGMSISPTLSISVPEPATSSSAPILHLGASQFTPAPAETTRIKVTPSSKREPVREVTIPPGFPGLGSSIPTACPVPEVNATDKSMPVPPIDNIARMIQAVFVGPRKVGKSSIASYFFRMMYPSLFDTYYQFSSNYEPTKLNCRYSYTDLVTPSVIYDFPGTDDVLQTLETNRCDPSLTIVLVVDKSLATVQKPIEHFLATNRRFCIVVSKLDEHDAESLTALRGRIMNERHSMFFDADLKIFYISAKDPGDTIIHWMSFVEFLKIPQPGALAVNSTTNGKLTSALQLQERYLNCKEF